MKFHVRMISNFSLIALLTAIFVSSPAHAQNWGNWSHNGDGLYSRVRRSGIVRNNNITHESSELWQWQFRNTTNRILNFQYGIYSAPGGVLNRTYYALLPGANSQIMSDYFGVTNQLWIQWKELVKQSSKPSSFSHHRIPTKRMSPSKKLTQVDLASRLKLPGLTAWWPGEGDPQNQYSSNPGIAYMGMNYADGKYGQAFGFDGENDYATLDGGVPTGDAPRTIEFWVYTEEDSWKSTQTLFEYGTGGYPKSFKIQLQDSYINVSIQTEILRVDAKLPKQGWFHLAVVYDGKRVLKLYVNGKLIGTKELTTSLDTTPSKVTLGRSSIFQGQYFYGLIDEVKVYNRALSDEEVSYAYAGTIKRPQQDGIAESMLPMNTPSPDRVKGDLVAHWRGESNALDDVGAQEGQTKDVSYSVGKTGRAFDFNGTTSRIVVPDSDKFRITRSMTVSAWIFIRSFPPQRKFGVVIIRGDDRDGLDPYTLTLTPTEKLRFQIASLSSSKSIESPISSDRWNHVAAVLDDATGKMQIYLNGILAVEDRTDIRPFSDLNPSENPRVVIGNAATMGSLKYNFPFNGMIDELEIYSRAFTQEEVRILYNNGIGDGTGSTDNSTLSVNAPESPRATIIFTSPLLSKDYEDFPKIKGEVINGNDVSQIGIILRSSPHKGKKYWTLWDGEGWSVLHTPITPLLKLPRLSTKLEHNIWEYTGGLPETPENGIYVITALAINRDGKITCVSRPIHFQIRRKSAASAVLSSPTSSMLSRDTTPGIVFHSNRSGNDEIYLMSYGLRQ